MNIDEALFEALGVNNLEADNAFDHKAFMPQAHFNNMLQVIDRSGALEFIEEEISRNQLSAAGRPPLISIRAVFVGLLLNAYWGFGSTLTELATTLATRLTPRQREQLEISVYENDKRAMYKPAWRALQRALSPIDPWHKTKKHRRLTSAEFQQANQDKDERREHFANHIANLIITASTSLLPQKYRDEWDGSIALDATLVEIMGKPNRKVGDRLNVDFTAGVYARHGDHAGTDKDKWAFGYELDTTVLVNTQRDYFHFPLITGVFLHRPGEIKIAGRASIDYHMNSAGGKVGTLLVDRAYNQLETGHFHWTARKHRFETAYKYKKNQLGFQAAVKGKPVIMVDGSLYLETMPLHLQQFTKWKAAEGCNPNTGEVITDELAERYFAEREKYRLKPHGKIKADGSQRYSYPPNIARLKHFDRLTNKLVKAPIITATTITIKPDDDVIRHLQSEPYGSSRWKKLTGARNHVENSNNMLKDSNRVDFGDPKKRRGRGFAFHALMSAFAVAAENIHRIVSGIRKIVKTSESPTKARNKKPTSQKPASVIIPDTYEKIEKSVAKESRSEAPPGS